MVNQQHKKRKFNRIQNKVNKANDSNHAIALHLYMDKRLLAFERLLTIMDELREQCPWDQKQTFDTLRNLTIEETYELADAITKNDLQEIKGEIGDLFLHMVFYSKLGSEVGAFDVTDVLHGICDKLVHRHPHIYGDVTVSDEAEVKANWEKLKLKEGKKSVLSGVPPSLPALVKATRIQEKVKGIGFEWDNKEDVWAKVKEELAEFEAEVALGSTKQEEEFGDLLFSLVNYARFINLSPESALSYTNQKFIKRFQWMEEGLLNGPMAYPFFSIDKELREKLKANQIYVPKYWPNVSNWVKEDSVENRLSENLLLLPVDQRYGKKEMKKIIKFGVFIVLIILIAIVVFNYPRLNIITGFAAKSVCSCTFEAERDQQSIEADDNDIDPIYLAKNVINFEEKSVTSTVFGLKKRVAIYKSGIGCVLVPEDLKLTTLEVTNRIEL